MRYFEDYEVGQEFKLGSYTMVEQEMLDFARQFDPQSFHLDAERAKDSIFGGLIASGWHTAAIYMRLMVTSFINETSSQGSPGVDELRWLVPVRVNDTLSGSFQVLECIPSRSRPTIGIIKGKCELVNQKGEIVLRILSSGFFDRRPAAQ